MDEEEHFQKALSQHKEVSADPLFKARLRLSLEREYVKAHRRQPHSLPLARQVWIPWSLAAAAVIVLVFNVGFNMGIDQNKKIHSYNGGLAFEHVNNQWRVLNTSDHSEATSFYIPTGSRSLIEDDLGAIIAEDDCRLDFEGSKTVHVKYGTGRAEFKPKKTMNVKVSDQFFTINGKAEVNLKSPQPQFTVKQGQAFFISPDGRKVQLKVGQQVPISRGTLGARVSAKAIKNIFSQARAGQIVKEIIPQKPMSDELIHERLKLAQRLAPENGLVKTIRLLPQLQGESRQAAWVYIKSHSFEEVLRAQQLVDNEIPKELNLVDSLNRTYQIKRVEGDLFRVTVDGEDVRFMNTKEIMDHIPLEVVAKLPPEWGLEESW